MTLAAALFFDNAVFPQTLDQGRRAPLSIQPKWLGPRHLQPQRPRLLHPGHGGAGRLHRRRAAGPQGHHRPVPRRPCGAARRRRRASGINLTWQRVLVFALSGAVAGIGGTLLAIQQQQVSADALQLRVLAGLRGHRGDHRGQHRRRGHPGRASASWSSSSCSPTCRPIRWQQPGRRALRLRGPHLRPTPRGSWSSRSAAGRCGSRSGCSPIRAPPTPARRPARGSGAADAGGGRRPAPRGRSTPGPVATRGWRDRRRCSRVPGSPRPSAGSLAVDDVTLRRRARARASDWSGPTGPARRPCSTASAGSSGPTRAPSSSTAQALLDLPTYRRARMGIGRTYQRIEVFPDMTVRDHLWWPSGPAGRGAAVEGPVQPESRPTPDELAGSTRCSSWWADRDGRRPGVRPRAGLCRLVELARALVGDPVCSWPTSRRRGSTSTRPGSWPRCCARSDASGGWPSCWSSTTWAWWARWSTGRS